MICIALCVNLVDAQGRNSQMPHFKSLPCAATNVNPQLVSSYMGNVE
jgi:hypothetical protein